MSLLVIFCALLTSTTGSLRTHAEPSSRVLLDRVAAVVGDQIILYSELDRQTQRHPLFQEAMSQLPANAGPELVEQKRRDVEAQVLDELIDTELMRAEARRFDLRVSDQDIDQALPNVAAGNGLTVEELKQQVEASEIYGSWNEYREELRDFIVQHRVTQTLATWSVSEAQVREHYRKMTRDETAKVRVEQFIFNAASDDPRARDRAFAQAQSVAGQLREGDEAADVSQAIGYSRPTERTIGRGDIAPGLEAPIFAAQVGQVVGPTASGQGYVVFKVLEQLASAALGYDEAKRRIRAQLEEQAFLKAELELRRQLRAKSHIDIRL